MPTRWLFLSPISHSFKPLFVRTNKIRNLVNCINKRVQITTQPNIRRLNKPKYPSFVWQFSENHEPFGYVQAYLNEPFHVLHLKYQRKYEKRRKDTLWWTAITGVNTAPKSAVRNYCCRKLRAAFVKALQIRGFDRDGRIPASDEYPDGRDGILGSVRFTCVKPMITVDPSSLEMECLSVVDSIIRTQRQKSMRAHLIRPPMSNSNNLV